MPRIAYHEALQQSGLLTLLSSFTPQVVGTPPLGLDMPDSDIDIVCEVHDQPAFATLLEGRFGGLPGFEIGYREMLNAVVIRFCSDGWPFEIFGQPLPVAQQHGWRHFVIEQRLIALGGSKLTKAIMTLRRQGLKTEPAFARRLELEGDPYAALLLLEGLDDAALRQVLKQSDRE